MKVRKSLTVLDDDVYRTYVDVPTVHVGQLRVLEGDLWPPNRVQVGDVLGHALLEGRVRLVVVNVTISRPVSLRIAVTL